MAYIVGLTGGIGSGKTTVSDYLHTCGASIIDLDILSHELTQKNSKLTQNIQKQFIQNFQINVCNENGTLNRKLLSNYSFNNQKAILLLENLIYPELYQQALEKIKLAQGPYIVLVVPLLVEKKMLLDRMDRILLLDCQEKTQITRSMKRDQLDEQQIKNIISHQATRQQRFNLANDYILNENKSKELLVQEVYQYHQLYLELAKEKNKIFIK